VETLRKYSENPGLDIVPVAAHDRLRISRIAESIDRPDQYCRPPGRNSSRQSIEYGSTAPFGHPLDQL